jgi:hypothetical protein
LVHLPSPTRTRKDKRGCEAEQENGKREDLSEVAIASFFSLVGPSSFAGRTWEEKRGWEQENGEREDLSIAAAAAAITAAAATNTSMPTM